MQAPMSPTHSNHPSQVQLVFQASNDRGVLQQAVPVQQSHISPMPIELERRMLQQPMHAQQSPFPPMLMPMQQALGIHAMRGAPIYSYNSPALHMPTISQPRYMSPMPAQQAPTEHEYVENAKKKLLDDPSSDQIQIFLQRAWSSKKLQIDLHEWVGEMRKERRITKDEEATLFHRIHRRDHDIIKKIIDIRDCDDESKKTVKDEKSKKVVEKVEMLKDAAANACVKGGQITNVEPDGKPFLSARLRFKRTCRKKSAHILQVPCTKEEDIFNVQLVRFFVENVWKLERPNVIISVTGGAENFDLPPEHNAMLMRGMMEGTRKLKTWFITGGTNAGIMKGMGEARAKYNPSAPLIGITSLPAIAGGLQLRRMLQDAKNEDVDPAVLDRSPVLREILERCTSLKKDTLLHGGHKLKLPTYREREPHRAFQQDLSGAWIDFSSEKPIEGSVMSYEDLVHMDEARAQTKPELAVKEKKSRLDPNHSHFILVDDGGKDFGTDRDFRAAFESYVAKGDQKWLGLSKEFHRMDIGRGNAEAPTKSDCDLTIPVVLVCVQGGPGTVDTVLKACQSLTSVALLVRGSGKAADLLSDAVSLQYTPSHSAHVSWLNFDTKQDAFWKFLRLCGVDPREYKETQNRHDWGKAIKYIQSNQTDQHLLKNAGELVRTTYKLFATNSTTTNEKCLKIIVDSLNVAETKRCWVYDLQHTEPGSDDFNLALLKCLLNGIAPVGQESADQLKKKLTLSMTWSCDYIIDYILERLPEKVVENEKLQILNDALLDALKEHNVHALSSLIHRGTGVQILDVGDGFCYVKDFFNYCDSKSVVFTVKMPYTETAFDAVQQRTFTAAMANTARISPEKVVIQSIECYEDNRVYKVKVETKLLAANSARAQALVSKLGFGIALKAKIDAQLKQEGLAASTDEPMPISDLSKESIKNHFVKFCEGVAAKSAASSDRIFTDHLQKCSSLHLKVLEDAAKKKAADDVIDRIFLLFEKDSKKEHSKDRILKCGLSSLHLKVLEDAAKSANEDPRDYKGRKRYFDAASKWTALIDQAKKQNPDFVVMWEKAENLRSQTMQDNHEHESSWKQKHMNAYEKYKQDCLQAAQPIPEHLRLEVYQYHYRQKSACKEILDILEKEKKNDNNFNALIDNVKEQKKRVTNMMNLLLLEGLYVDLVGPAFRYRMGVLGDPWFDMFFWYVLQNEKDLACLMWEHVKYPVRSAICAAYLLRRMANNKNIDPIEREKMLESCIFFDKQATDVQRAAEDDDENRELAAKSLDCELFLWRGTSLMDLAVQGECESFLKTESFKRSLHCRLYGDLEPDGNYSWWRQTKLIGSTLTCGLAPIIIDSGRNLWAYLRNSPHISSWFLEWTPPPRSQVTRHSTQRRRIPPGYPHHPSKNPILKQVKDSRKHDALVVSREIRLTGLLKKTDNETKDLTSHQLETLWAPTFGPYERWKCFMSAPYVLFLLNCFVAVGVTLYFTVWFIWMRLEPLSFPDMDKKLTGHPDMDKKMTGHEIFLLVYFLGCLVREILQLFVSICKCHGGVDTLKGIWSWRVLIYKGFGDYFSDNWNYPELLALIFFFVGFGWRTECINKSGGCEYAFSTQNHTIWLSFSVKDSPIETHNLFYALSLFFNWIRVLRCFYLTPLGVTIGIFFSMTKDILSWLYLYAIVLVAISMLFVGTSSVETLVPGYETCSKGTDVPENGYIACVFSYVFFRPMLQSFGEFSLSEMTNVYSFIFLLVTYFFLNLVLINLLIATMSSTYSKVSAKAEHWKLLYEYELVQEHARRAIAFPPPLNVLVLIFDLVWSFRIENVRRIYPDYTWYQRLERFLARNTTIGPDSRVRGATHSSQDHGFDRQIQADISVFMERARRTVMNKGHSKGSLEDRLANVESKLDSISKDAKSIQDMQQASNRGSTRARMLDKRALYANTLSGT